MQEILTERAKLINTAKQNVLENIASLRRSTRERAIKSLTEGLDPQSERDKVIFQTIPLELIERDDIVGAILYIETIGKSGNNISLEVLEKVIEASIDARFRCIESEDHESLKEIDSSVKSLFRMSQQHSELKDISKLFLLMGKFEHSKGDTYKAITYYDTAIEKADIDGYIFAAMAYDELGHYDSVITILDYGYALYKDIRLLGPYIQALCKIGKIPEAIQKHEELCSLEKGIFPFVVYKGYIENDRELLEIEDTIAGYMQKGFFEPSEALGRASKSAAEYIFHEVNIENEKIQRFKDIKATDLTQEDSIEYNRIIFRRLQLLQIDILTLCNHRYLEYYLGDLEELGFENPNGISESFEDFFVDNSSKEALREINLDSRLASDKEEDLDESDESPMKRVTENSVFENLSLHVARTGELFFQPGFYGIQESQISSLLKKSAIYEGDFDDEMDEGLFLSMRALKDSEDFYNSLNPSVRENYENFIRQIDEKYGVFYRRQIQFLANDSDMDPEKYPIALREYPDIALLFWMQKIISQQFPTNDPEEIEEIVQTYGLYRVNILNGLTFGALIFEISIEYSIGFLADYPNMLDVPLALYIITEGLRSMDRKSKNMAIKDLHAIAKEDYKARGFFEHVRYIFGEIYKDDPSESETTDMLLTSGNVVILQNKVRTQAIFNFHTAGEEFGSLEGLLQAGDSYENMEDYERAMEYFEQALLQDDSIIVLTKILNCAICSYQFDTAERYIQYAIHKGYSINNYILALFLWKGNTHAAFLQMIQMIREKQDIINMPEGLPRLLCNTLDYVLKTPDTVNRENDILKIQASYILTNISFDEGGMDYSNGIKHWQQINALSDFYEGDALHVMVEDSIATIIGKLEGETKEIISSSDQSIEYLHQHGRNLYIMYQKILEDTEDPKIKGVIRKYMSDLCALVILTLRKFPDSEDYVRLWRDGIFMQGIPHDPNSKLYSMPETIQ